MENKKRDDNPLEDKMPSLNSDKREMTQEMKATKTLRHVDKNDGKKLEKTLIA